MSEVPLYALIAVKRWKGVSDEQHVPPSLLVLPQSA